MRLVRLYLNSQNRLPDIWLCLILERCQVNYWIYLLYRLRELDSDLSLWIYRLNVWCRIGPVKNVVDRVLSYLVSKIVSLFENFHIWICTYIRNHFVLNNFYHFFYDRSRRNHFLFFNGKDWYEVLSWLNNSYVNWLRDLWNSWIVIVQFRGKKVWKTFFACVSFNINIDWELEIAICVGHTDKLLSFVALKILDLVADRSTIVENSNFVRYSVCEAAELCRDKSQAPSHSIKRRYLHSLHNLSCRARVIEVDYEIVRLQVFQTGMGQSRDFVLNWAHERPIISLNLQIVSNCLH